MKELLLCALKRQGKPATAGDLTDAACALAMEAGWPRRTWANLQPRAVAGVLKSLRHRREVEEVGERAENGRSVPLFQPRDGWDAKAPMPAAPDPEGEDHPLHGTTNRQKFVLFDVMDSCLNAAARQRSELNELVNRHNRELAELAARAKRELMAAGLEGAR